MKRLLAWIWDAQNWQPPNPPTVTNCGGGRGEACCKFLIADADGIGCARYTDLHPVLLMKEMGAKFVPDTADCQAERAALDAQPTT